MTPNERNLDALFEIIESEIRRLETLQAKTDLLLHANFTTSDKLQIRKLRLKK